MRRRAKLSPKGAIWSGLIASPVIVVAAVAFIGVMTGSAGPTAVSAAQAGVIASADGVAVRPSSSESQTVAEVAAFWTPERMSQAEPYPMPTRDGGSSAAGSVQTVPQATGPAGTVAGTLPSGAVASGTGTPQGGSTDALTEPYHANVPFSRWSYMGAYRRYPMWTVHKMFFQQDHDGNGTVSSFVCSSSTIGVDGVWTAGHCLNNGLNGAGANGGWSSNISFCPSYDNAINIDGCWGVEANDMWVLTEWYATGDLDGDLGGADATPTSTAGNGLIGNTTGTLGLAWNFPANQHWVGFGYPQGSPFNGQKIITCQSSLGYLDDAEPPASAVDSVAMGCDMTGGSSGGPWVISWGFTGQQGGGGNNWVNGHNDWRHTAEPGEMASMYYDTRACLIYELVNDVDLGNCP